MKAQAAGTYSSGPYTFRRRHVSNTSRPLKSSVPTPAIQRSATTLRKNRLSSEVPMSTHRPTVRKPPQALKSRRLTNA